MPVSSESGLTAWWRAESNVVDAATATSYGKLSSGAGYAPGIVGRAFDFDGVTGSLKVPNAYSPCLTNHFTIEAWINARSFAGAPAIVTQEGGTGRYDYGLIFGISQTTLRALFHGIPSMYSVSYTGSFVPGQWYHVAMTYDQLNVRLFVNGQQVAAKAIGARTIQSWSTDFRISGDDWGYADCFNGLIDELAVFNRALADSELAAIYSAGASGKCTNALAPYILSQPISQNAESGDDAVLSVMAGGSAPLAYQWRWSEGDVSGATNSVLVLTNVQTIQSGDYWVVITNVAGAVTSCPAAVIVTPSPSAPCVTLASGVVGWWQGEGNTFDQLGNHGGSLTSVAYAAGRVGMAFDFDGPARSVVVPNASSLCLSNQFTMEAWVKPRSFSRDQAIVSKVGGGGGNNGYEFLFTDQANLQGQFNSPGGAWPEYRVSYAGSFVTGKWYHVAWTYDQSTLCLYVNGELVAGNVIGSHPIATSSSNFRIGADDNNYCYFNGLIDEPGVYCRALSASEIAAIYSAGTGGKCFDLAAPSICAPPASQTVQAGDDATFKVVACGSGPFKYQWQWNGGKIDGATTAALVLTSVQVSQSGNYSVVISNAWGAVTSSSAVLTVASLPPCVTPASGLIGWWRGEGNTLDESGGYNAGDLTSVALAPGRVGQAFDFDGVSRAVVISNSTGLCFSNQFTIEAWAKARSFAGDRAIISKVGGAGGNNGYQLLFSNSVLQGQFNSAGVEWPGYTVSYAGSFVAGQWYHLAWTYDQSAMRLYVNGQPVATNAIGLKIVASSASDFRIGADDNYHDYFNGLIDEPAIYSRALSASEVAAIYNAGGAGKCFNWIAPFISTQPASQTVETGDDITLKVGMGGTGPLSYQWQWNGVNLNGATNSALALSNLQPNQSGNYGIVITNRVGAVTSSPAVLTVNAMPSPPCATSASGIVGWWRGEESAHDELGVYNGGPLTRVAYAPGRVGQAFDFDGATRSVVVPDAASLRLSGQFTIEAWIKSRSFAGAQSIVSKKSRGGAYNEWFNSGYQFLFTETTLRGRFNSAAAFWPGFEVAYTNSFAAGKWYHVAWTYDLSAMRLYVNGQMVATQTIGTKMVTNTTWNFRIGADDNNRDYFNGSIDEPAIYNRALSASEITAIFGASGAGKCYTLAAPTISVQPTSQSLQTGDDVSLSVVAAGTEPLRYQWRWNGSHLEGATASALVLNNLRADQSGSYDVVITNVAGAVTSSPAVLAVPPTSPCVPPVSGLIAWWRAEGNVLDESGMNDGSALDNVVYGVGKVGQAFDFDGATRSVEVLDTGSLCLSNQFTIEAWIKSRSFAGEQAIVSKVGGGSGDSGYQFLFTQTTLRGLFNSAGVLWPGYEVSYTGPFRTGTWYHVAWTYDQSRTRLYVNGQEGASNIGEKAVAASASHFRIGADDNYHDYFNGLIDEPAVYGRALSAGEIAAIYNAGAGGKCPGPIAPLPVLSIAPIEHGIVLAWPLWATNFLLEAADGSLESGATWSNLSVIPVIQSNENRVFLPASGTNRYFRLHSP